MQTCYSVKCQLSPLPDSPSVLHCASPHHRHVNLAKSSAVGPPGIFPALLFLTHCCSSGKIADFEQSLKRKLWSLRTSREDSFQLKVSQASLIYFTQLLNSVVTSVRVLSKTAVPPAVLCTSLSQHHCHPTTHHYLKSECDYLHLTDAGLKQLRCFHTYTNGAIWS